MTVSDVTFSVSGELPDDSRDIRTEVFMDEQGFKAEFDDIDAISTHLVGYVGGEPASTCRIYPVDGAFEIGRVAVRAKFRGMSLGSATVLRAEEEIVRLGGSRSVLSAQVRVKGFYESLGYVAEGDEYLDEFCPHVLMTKSL